MRADQDGMMLVRADLCERLDALQRTMQRLTVRELMQQLGTIRTVALAYGLLPVAAVADALTRAIAAEPRGCPAGLYFDRLRDAIGCERLDPAAEQAMLASVSLRFVA
ncbi:hypothetical protein [Allosphingosinicella sp.]|uniref:hypothetical protein n=1 Tax=Allosphingosinicella sp. TaxID=2823234 RepID=UPI003782E00A